MESLNRGSGRARMLCLLPVVLATLSACSTVKPYESGRRGLFDGLTASGRDYDGGVGDQDYAHLKPSLGQWAWPVRNVTVTSFFGRRDGDMHEGVDFRAPTGTNIHASQDGVVSYSGSGISGYGKMVVINHGDGLSTVYAHNSKLLVKKGQKVRRNQVIALSGQTGRATGPHLHYEIRKGLTAIDPLKFLPQVRDRKLASGRGATANRAVSARRED